MNETVLTAQSLSATDRGTLRLKTSDINMDYMERRTYATQEVNYRINCTLCVGTTILNEN